MKRSFLRAAIPAPDPDDTFTTPASKKPYNDFPAVQTTTSTTANGDDFVLTNAPAKPYLPPSDTTTTIPPPPLQQQQQQHRGGGGGSGSEPNPLLEVTTLVLWIVLILTTLYYLVTEQTRRRRRLRRERQERLEVYSPQKQYHRRAELVLVLKPTTMTVQPHHLICYNPGHSDCDNDHDVGPVEEGSKDTTTTSSSIVETVEEDEPSATITSTSNENNDEDDDDDNPENDDHDEPEIQQLWCAVGQPLDLSSSSWDDNDDEEQQHYWTLTLPTREVPASCIICLRRFRVQEQISWSNSCPHAFHQPCIIEWLAKLPDCNCPVCRNPFCQLASNPGRTK